MFDFCTKLFYNTNMKELTTIKPYLLRNKINICLTKIGFNEKYAAFEYISYILLNIIAEDNNSLEFYNKLLENLSNRHNISTVAIAYSLKKLTNMCKYHEIFSKSQFNLKNNATLNRIRVIKNYILTNI